MSRAWLGDASDPWRLLRETRDLDIPLFEAALLVAREFCPDLDAGHYLDLFDNHVARLRRRLDRAASSIDGLRLLNQYLFADQGFSGNFFDYYDPRNSYVHEVLDRKLGIPISLSLLYIELGQQLGLHLQGVSFPGHFLVRLPVDGGVIVLDPYHGGKSVGADELKLRARSAMESELPDDQELKALLAPSEQRGVLVRLLANLEHIHQERQDLPAALTACDRLFRLTDEPRHLKTRARLYQQIGAMNQAAADWKAYLARTPEPDPEDALEHLNALRQARRLH